MSDSGTRAGAPVTIVFCGGCNPHIDRAALAAALPVDDPDVHEGATVFVSGCPRACASGHQLVAPGGRETAPADGRMTSADEHAAPADEETRASNDGALVVVVAGELVDGVFTPFHELAATVTRRLKE